MTVDRAATVLADTLNWDYRTVQLQAADFRAEALCETDLGAVPDYQATAKGCRRPLWCFFAKERPLLVSMDRDRLSSYGCHLGQMIRKDAEDARLGFDPGGRPTVFPEQMGREMDLAVFEKTVVEAFCQGVIPEIISIPVIDVPPRTLARELETYLPLTKLATCVTYYADMNDRAFNIGLACAPLSGITINPGETLSFNDTVGARTPERGYRKAPTFWGDETVDDYGGGVCQVSTTLYVVLLKAGFGVEERHCHYRPVGYVPMGLDATVVYEYLDVKMTNTTDAPCLLQMVAKGGQLTASVFGKATTGLTIEVEPRVLKEFPPEGFSTPGEIDGQTLHQGGEHEDGPGSEHEGGPDSEHGRGSGSEHGGGPENEHGGAPDSEHGSRHGGEHENGGTAQQPRSGFLVETVRLYLKDGRVERVEVLDTSMYPAEKPKTR